MSIRKFREGRYVINLILGRHKHIIKNFKFSNMNVNNYFLLFQIKQRVLNVVSLRLFLNLLQIQVQDEKILFDSTEVGGTVSNIWYTSSCNIPLLPVCSAMFNSYFNEDDKESSDGGISCGVFKEASIANCNFIATGSASVSE